MEKQVRLEEILILLAGKSSCRGNPNAVVSRVIQLNPENDDPETLSWCNEKYLDQLAKVKTGVVICPRNVDGIDRPEECTWIMVPNPRSAFREVLTAFFMPPQPKPGIAPNATIHPSAKIGDGVSIAPGVVVEAECELKEGVIIGPNTVLHSGTLIHKNAKVGANCTIGGVGFGYEKDEAGNYVVMPHLGNVIIEENAEIGNNTCIDRAVLGSTLIRKNAKVDNLVHIAHGVEIGENALIIANAMIAGSVKIGKNAWVAPSASVLNKKSVGDDTTIGMGAVVIRNVEAGQTVVGNPAKPLGK